ncbi:MAG TPA: hypothetical protein VNI20_07990 [Fimbriimonadaceae bacterium]|nr:hypothetical protein [Fimbriimonadaceae bacterium]
MKLDKELFSPAAYAAIAVIVLAFAFDLLYPKPGSGAARKVETIAQMRQKTQTQQGQLDSLVSANDNLVWTVGRDEIGPKAMAWVSKQASANFVKISAFRPQSVVDVGDLVQLNYLVSAQGPYLNVMRFIKQFESKDSHLAIKMVQIGSVNGATDDVRATLALVAYQEVTKGG